MSDSLLPRAATPLERAIEASTFRLDPARTLPTLWDVETCPESLLPWLASAVAVDEWDPQWSEARKRDAIRESREIHARKGTLSAIRRALSVCGQAEATVIERADHLNCDGRARCDGTYSCGGQWATVRVVLLQPVTVPQARQIQRLIAAVGRNCVWLLSIEFAASAFRCDGSIPCDGSHTCGTVNTLIN